MKGVIIGGHLKVISKSIRLMSKYSDDMTMVVQDSGLVFRAVSDSKTSYVEVHYKKDFFSTYTFDQEMTCSVSIKSMFLVFKVVSLGKSM